MTARASRRPASASMVALPAPAPVPAPGPAGPSGVPGQPVTAPESTPTLTEFLIDEQRKVPEATGSYTALVNDIRLACKRIANIVGKGQLVDAHGKAGTVNVQGESQAKLDVVADEIFYRTHLRGGIVAAMLSEEQEGIRWIPPDQARGRYLLAYDPLDGSSNIDVNVSVGSIFSVLLAPDRAVDVGPGAFLQPGTRQVCAGYAIYGPTTMLVLSLGHGVHGFTLDREIGEFILTHPDMRIPETGGRVRHQRVEFAALGAGGHALRGRMPGRQQRAARSRLQHALGRLPGRRGSPDPDPRRGVPVPTR